MKYRSTYLLAILATTSIAIATDRYAFADDSHPAVYDNVLGFADWPCLVAFDLGGANGVEQTVLIDASITDIGGKRFLEGIVTDKYPEVKVAFLGKPAYIALDRIAYIQILDVPKTENGG